MHSEYFCAKNLTSGFVRVFFDRCSWWRKRRWNSLYGHFSRKNTPVHASTRARAANQHASIGSTARDSLGKNVSKEVCFWLWGKDILVQLPKRTHRYVNSGYSLFFRGSNGVSQVFCWRTFYKQGPIRRWICTSFNTERWSGPSYKRSRSWFRTADGEWNGIKCLCFVGDRHRHSLAPPTTRLHSLAPPTRHASRSSAFFGENRKSVSFFYKYDKTKDFLEIWRMQYYSIGTQD